MSTSDFDVDLWLGGAEATEEQREAIRSAEQYVSARYPDEQDTREDAELALAAATGVILDDRTLAEVADRWQQTRRAEVEARASLTGAIIASVVLGESELGIATRLGIARDTVRKALSK